MTPDRFQKLKAILNRRQPDLTVLTDSVHKTHNIAAITRTCDAVGIFELHAVLSQGRIARHHDTSGGAGKWVKTHTHRNLETACAILKDSSHNILAAHFSATARDFRDVDYTSPTAVVLGSELDGVSWRAAELADQHIVIPMEGMVASLNVSVAAAVILFEAQRQRVAAGLYEQSRLDPEQYRTTLFEWAYPDIARRLREKHIPYPDLTDDGTLAHNPLSKGTTSI